MAPASSGRCKACGCTELAACPVVGRGGKVVGCSWMDEEQTMCSSCFLAVERPGGRVSYRLRVVTLTAATKGRA
jgi:hypothetical protein